METTLIRGFVLFLALTGFGASSFSSRPTAKAAIGGGGPTPLCAPNSGHYCGMD